MKAVTMIMTSAAGIAALGMAAPAAAQYYPGYGQGTNVIGQVLRTILNPYGQQQRYAMNPQAAVSQCSAAVQNRLTQRYSAGYSPYARYNPYGGYNQGYNSGYSSARVVSITRVEPRSSTTMRVRGYATSGRTAAYNPYGGYGGYGGYNAAAAADMTFKCDVDYRGYVRDIDFNRRY